MMDDDARDSKRVRVGNRFRITSPDEPHQFVNTWFSLTVYVVNEEGQLKSGGGDKSFEILLGVDEEENTYYSPELIEVDPTTPQLITNGNGRADVQIKILKCSMNDLSRNFFIEVRGTDNNIDIALARTGNIIVIKHQLQLSPNINWEDEWYKDEGGREKCVSFGVELRNSKGEFVNRKVPLKITLVYGNGQEVARQDILKLMDSDKVIIDGRAEIRARIEEVSRTHQNQPFHIRVGPDVNENPLDNDVSSVLSSSVVVRSKRNNRKKTAPILSATPQTAQKETKKANPKPNIDTHQHKPVTQRGDGRDEAAAALVSVKYIDNQQYQSVEPLIVSRQASFSSIQGEKDGSREALTHVLKWIGFVLDTAERLKWKEEFDRLPDGSLDTTPRFTMRNPNKDIDNLLQSYKSDVMSNLNTLIEDIENKDSGSDNSHEEAEADV
jgi:hypothetical protein